MCIAKAVPQVTKAPVAVRLLSMDISAGTATGKLLLTLMAGIAAFERELMLERQRHGIAVARAAWKYKGRAPTARAQTAKVAALKLEGKRVPEIAQLTGMSRASVYRMMADAGKN